MVHLSCLRKKPLNKKGYSAIIGTIFMVLVILFFYFNILTFSTNRNTDFQDMVARTQQLDSDRNAEQITISNVQIPAVENGEVLINFTLINNGSVPIQVVRLWLQDFSQNSIGNVSVITPPFLLQPGSINSRTFFVPLSSAGKYDFYRLWFITSRGNSFSISFQIPEPTPAPTPTPTPTPSPTP